MGNTTKVGFFGGQVLSTKECHGGILPSTLSWRQVHEGKSWGILGFLETGTMLGLFSELAFEYSDETFAK